MRVSARLALCSFWERHPGSEQPLKAWFAEARAAVWQNPSAIKRRYRHASFLAENRVIFNIGANKYRLLAHVNYDFQIVYIKCVGTHAEYDRIGPEII